MKGSIMNSPIRPILVAWFILGAQTFLLSGMAAELQASELSTKLKGMSDNSWLNLNMPWEGGQEIPAAFDQENQLLFKYGGCCDRTPPVKISFPQGDHRYPNGYSNTCWVIDIAKGGWEQRREYDCSWPNDRPANGCSRNYCYDSKRKVIWMYGGISDGGGGGGPWDMWYYDGKTDKFTHPDSKGVPQGGDGNGGDVFSYDPIHDILIMPRGKITMIYKPAEAAWEERQTPDAPPSTSHYGSLAFDVSAKRLVYPLAVSTGKSLQAAPPAAETNNYWYDHKTNTWWEHTEEVFTYDPETNKWQKLEIKSDAPRPCWRKRCGLTYDSSNNVVILVSGSTDTWDDKERCYNDVWILDTAKAAWTEMKPSGQLPVVGARDCRHCAYDEKDNVVFYMNAASGVWAYKYKTAKK